MKRASVNTLLLSMLFGLFVSAAEPADWPAGTRKVIYVVPPGGSEYLFLGLSPVVTSPSSGGQCLVTCQINTESGAAPSRAHIRARTDLGDGTRTGNFNGDVFRAHEVTPFNSGGLLASDPYFAYLQLTGQEASVTTTNVYKLAGSRRFTFGCQVHPVDNLEEYALFGRISWICR